MRGGHNSRGPEQGLDALSQRLATIKLIQQDQLVEQFASQVRMGEKCSHTGNDRHPKVVRVSNPEHGDIEGQVSDRAAAHRGYDAEHDSAEQIDGPGCDNQNGCYREGGSP